MIKHRIMKLRPFVATIEKYCVCLCVLVFGVGMCVFSLHFFVLQFISVFVQPHQFALIPLYVYARV